MSIVRFKALICSIGALCSTLAFADNQTSTVSPILPGNQLPFSVSIELSDFTLPNGFHSGAMADHKGQWLFIAGRTNGMHGFLDNPTNFPPQKQNTDVFVIDFEHKKVYTRSLYDPDSGLTQDEIDQLTVTSPQSYQKHDTLYISGGYGVVTATGDFTTKNTLTAIDVPGLIHWVKHPFHGETAGQHIRQIYDPIFQVTGGFMSQIGNEPTLLIFGQDFEGFYFDDGDGTYTQEVRRFYIIDDGYHLSVNILPSVPVPSDPNYRRRDLNIVPFISNHQGRYVPSFVALSGVFTPTTGIWTVPVAISADGQPSMADPSLPGTFKQGMNNYVSATLGMFSKKSKDMYTTLFGGISYGYFSDGTIHGTFITDSEFPFINQVTTVSYDKKGRFKQYLMEAQFPTLYSTSSNPGNKLLFGAAAYFIPSEHIVMFKNGVVDLDVLNCGCTFVGYIIGGIQSTMPNTNSITDSTASNYVFKVYVHKR